MNSAPRVRRPWGAVLGLGLMVGASLASCANGDGTGLGGEAASASAASAAGATQAGTNGIASAGRGQGGMNVGGASANGGTLPTSGTGGTITAGTGAGGSSNSGGTGVGGTPSGGGMAGGVGATSGSGATAGNSGAVCDDLPPNNGQTCQNAVGYGWCTQDWLGNSCRRTCGKCTGGGTGGSGGMTGAAGTSGTGSGGSGNSGSVAPPPDIQGGMQAWGSRYWDCCKPACGWSGNVGGRQPAKACDKSGNPIGDVDAKNACESGGSAFACWSDRPWSVGDKLSYGFVAKNDTCGRCYHVQFTGTSHNGSQDMSTQALAGKHMIVQVINNGAIAADQFDFLIPGGGVGLLDACSNQWGTSDLGAQYGGFLAGCNGDKTCVKNKCEQVFAGKQDLLDGCDWFLGWFGGADNPNFTYQKIACPSEITQRSGLSDPG